MKETLCPCCGLHMVESNADAQNLLDAVQAGELVIHTQKHASEKVRGFAYDLKKRMGKS